ncbi:MAG: hypothetical protein ACRDH9_09990 [Actinomycetota bacterium]
MLPKAPDGHQSPSGVLGRVQLPKLLADLALLPLKLLHDFLDEHRVDARRHATDLSVLFGSDGLEAALQPRTGLEGFFPSLPQGRLLVALQGPEALGTKQLTLQGADDLGL